MFYQIDSSLDGAIENGDPELTDFCDEALTSHRMSNIILALSRNQMRLIEGGTAFGALARKTATYISQKSSDYRAAMRQASRVIIVCDDSKTDSFSISGKFAYVNKKLISRNHILSQSFLLCENVEDAKLYNIIIKEALNSTGYPSSYIGMRLAGGGGSTLPQTLKAEQALPLKGMVICDADIVPSPPPFKHNSTAHKAFEAAKEINLCNSLGMSDCNPLFGLFTTYGPSIENIIGPNLLDSYFQSNGRPEERAKICLAFPSFPELSDLERVIFHVLDLKNGTRVLTNRFDIIREINGSVPPQIANRSNQLTSAVIPRDVIGWINENYLHSRYSGQIKDAIKRDLTNRRYLGMLRPLMQGALDLLAGDTAARRT